MLTMDAFGVDSSVQLPEQSVDDWRDLMLDELTAHVPRMDREHATRQEFWFWFEGEANSLILGATEDKQQVLGERLDDLLKMAGIHDRYKARFVRAICNPDLSKSIALP